MARHRARNLLGCGVLRLTNHRGVSIHLPLKPELLRMITALNTAPTSRELLRRPRRNIVVLAR
jgi:hypothetical protein